MTETTTYYAITIDPLHIGAGGYRLGRVDNTIIREPGTDLPKLPGSSISGVCRNYAIYALDEEEQKAARGCATHKNKKVKNNCRKCAICQTFGYASGEESKNQIGRVKFFDGAVTAYPVSTLSGPVWVTTKAILRNCGQDMDGVSDPGNEELLINFDLPGQKNGKKLNLGWLYLPCRKETFTLPDSITAKSPGKEIGDKLVIAPDWLFSEIVNSNLEVRTSVAIDFETGAAEPKKLFTYEAVPRATLVNFDVVIDDYRCNEEWTADKINKIIRGGLELFEPLGLGGMNTRGFGRMRILNLDKE